MTPYTLQGPKSQTIHWFNQTALDTFNSLKEAAEKKVEESGGKMRKVDHPAP